jgi:hypothetical protein
MKSETSGYSTGVLFALLAITLALAVPITVMTWPQGDLFIWNDYLSIPLQPPVIVSLAAAVCAHVGLHIGLRHDNPNILTAAALFVAYLSLILAIVMLVVQMNSWS